MNKNVGKFEESVFFFRVELKKPAPETNFPQELRGFPLLCSYLCSKTTKKIDAKPECFAKEITKRRRNKGWAKEKKEKGVVAERPPPKKNLTVAAAEEEAVLSFPPSKSRAMIDLGSSSPRALGAGFHPGSKDRERERERERGGERE